MLFADAACGEAMVYHLARRPRALWSSKPSRAMWEVLKVCSGGPLPSGSRREPRCFMTYLSEEYLKGVAEGSP